MKKKRKKKIKFKKNDIVHYCSKCRKKTKHLGQGEKWIKYVEFCSLCKSINYTEYKRKNGES